MVTIYRDNRRRRSAPREKRVKEKLGELHRSKGGVGWYQKGVSKNRVSKRWGQLARLIDPKGL